MIQMLNLELADTLGNLLNRSTSKRVNKNQIIPPYPSPHQFSSSTYTDLVSQLEDLRHRVGTNYNSFHVYIGIVQIMAVLGLIGGCWRAETQWSALILRRD